MTGSTPGRVVLVSGGGSGSAKRSSTGWRRGLLRRRPGSGAGQAVSVGRHSEDRSRLEIHRCDVASVEEVECSVASVLSRWGRLDALITVAGLLEFAHAADTSCATWERLVAVNMTGTFLMCRAALPHLLRTGDALSPRRRLPRWRGWPMVPRMLRRRAGSLRIPVRWPLSTRSGAFA